MLYSILFFACGGDDVAEIELTFPRTYLFTAIEHEPLVPYRVVAENEVELIESFAQLEEIDTSIEEDFSSFEFNPDSLSFQFEIIDEFRTVVTVTQSGITESDTLTYFQFENKLLIDDLNTAFFIDGENLSRGRICTNTTVFVFFEPLFGQRTSFFDSNTIDCDLTDDLEELAISQITSQNEQSNGNIQAGDTVMVKPGAMIFTLQN